MRDFICVCMYVRGQCVRAIESVSIRDIQKGQQGRMSRRAKKTKEGGNLENWREGGVPFLWWYWFDGCLAEAPKAVPAWILACHLGQGH